MNIDVEPHPYTLNEVTEMLKKGNPIIIDAFSEGVILYNEEEFKELLKLYEELLRRELKNRKPQ